MNGILKTGISIFLIVLILKFVLKAIGSGFIALISLAVIVMLVGIFKQVRDQ